MREGRHCLTIRDGLQIGYTEDGTAWYWGCSGTEPESVEAEVQSWMQFVDDWFQAFQVPRRPKRYSDYEQKVLNRLVNIRRQFSKALPYTESTAETETQVRKVLEGAAEILTANMGISSERVSEIVSGVLAPAV